MTNVQYACRVTRVRGGGGGHLMRCGYVVHRDFFVLLGSYPPEEKNLKTCTCAIVQCMYYYKYSTLM